MKTAIICIVMQLIAFHISMARVTDVGQGSCGEMQNLVSILDSDHEFNGTSPFELVPDEELSAIVTGRDAQNPEDMLMNITGRQDTIAADLQRVMNLMRDGNTEEASKICLKLMESHPNQREPVQMWLIMNMKRTPTGEEEAIGLLEELGKTYPQNTAILFFKAFIEDEYGHQEEALKDVEKLIQLQPDSSLNFIFLGQIMSAQNKHQEAFEAFDRATTLDPARFDVWGMKASALSKTGRYTEAIAAINKGIELAPDFPVFIYNRACLYSLNGDRENALADLKKAVSIDSRLKESAKQDADFSALFNDEEFKKLVAPAAEIKVSYTVQFNGTNKPDSVYLFIYRTTSHKDGQMYPEPVKAFATADLSSSFMIEPGSYTLGVAAWAYHSLKAVINFPADEKDLSIKVTLNPEFIGYGQITDVNQITSVAIRGDFNQFAKENEIVMEKSGTVWKPKGNTDNLKGGRYFFTVNGENTIDMMNKKVSPLKRWNGVFNIYDNNDLVFDPSLYSIGYKASLVELSWK